MLKILLGNSPPTNKSQFDTTAFEQFLEAKQRFDPDYFLFWGNSTLSKSIHNHIENQLNIKLQYIDDGLLSAQTHRRLYAHNIPDVTTPQNKNIIVKTILNREHSEKSYALQSGKYYPAPNKNLPPTTIRIGTAENNGKKRHDSRPYRVYSPYGKAITIMGNAGGAGGKTGLYACPINPNVHNGETITLSINKKYGQIYDSSDGITNIIALRQNIELPNGAYVIRKLSVTECIKMLGIPDGFNMPCSNERNYQLMGRTCNTDIIAHILSYIPNIKHEPLKIMSIYDGIAYGYIALNKIQADIATYYATESNTFAIKTADANFANILRPGNIDDIESDECWDEDTPVIP